jgi:hypothetical protein
MDRKEHNDYTWRSIWLLFGAMILLFVSIVILCVKRHP